MVSDFGETVKTENSFGVAMERDLVNWRCLSLFIQCIIIYLSLDSGYGHYEQISWLRK